MFVLFVRKLMFVVGIMVFLEFASFTIFNFNFNVLFFLMFILYMDIYKDAPTKWYAVFDECTLLIVNYCLFVFTDWGTVEQSAITGNVVIWIVSAYIVLFAMSFAFSFALVVVRYLKKVYAVYKIKQRIKIKAALEEERKKKDQEEKERKEKELAELNKVKLVFEDNSVVSSKLKN